MIYRILIDERWQQWDEEKQMYYFMKELKGAAVGLSDLMWKLKLPAPLITNPRARFYFTELGWRKIGCVLASEAKKRGHVVQVMRRKNPRRSQIVFADKLQMAILPTKNQKDVERFYDSSITSHAR
jgi:hypothetical protein